MKTYLRKKANEPNTIEPKKEEHIVLNLGHPFLWEDNDGNPMVVKRINIPGPINQYRFAVYDGNVYWCLDSPILPASPIYVQLEDSPERLIALYDDIEFVKVNH